MTITVNLVITIAGSPDRPSPHQGQETFIMAVSQATQDFIATMDARVKAATAAAVAAATKDLQAQLDELKAEAGQDEQDNISALNAELDAVAPAAPAAP